MPLVVKDRVRQTTTTTGTGTVTLNGTVVGFQSFSVIGDGNTTYYAIVDAATGDWEVGLGTYTLSGTTLSRDTVLESSNSGSLVPFAAGTKDVFCTYPAERSVYADSTTIAVPAANLTVNGVPYASSASALTTGSALTFNGSTLATTGALQVDGNTTLGNASTDTVTVNGTLGIGFAAQSKIGVYIAGNTDSVSVDPYGVRVARTITSNATSTFQGYSTQGLSTAASAFTIANIVGFSATDITKGAGSTITNQYGIRIEDQTQGTNNYGISSAVSSGANKWNIYASGTAANYFAGRIFAGNPAGRSVAGVNAQLQVEGTSTATSYFSITRNSNDSVQGGIQFAKSRGTTVGSVTAVVNGDTLGNLQFYGADGTTEVQAASILGSVDAAVSTGIVPGNLRFFTSNTSGVNGERMRIDSSGNVGIGTTAPLATTDVAPALSAGNIVDALFVHQLSGVSPTVGQGVRITLSANTNLTRAATITAAHESGTNAHYLAFGTSANGAAPAERMRIDSAGNVGIGTTSPGFNLEVTGAASTSATVRVTGGSGANTNAVLDLTGRGSGNQFNNTEIRSIGAAANGGTLTFHTDDTSAVLQERMRIDSSGNLGLGVTPSAWGGSYKAVQVGLAGAIASWANSSAVFGANGFRGASNYQYINSDFASLYQQASGTHSWFTAPSGTAGNAITFTQAMTLDASGRLLIGTTASRTNIISSGSRLQIEDTSSGASPAFIRNSADVTASYVVLGKSRGTTIGSFTAVTSGDQVGGVSFEGADGTALAEAARVQAFVDGTVSTGVVPGRLVFWTANTSGSLTERMRIDSSGNINIATAGARITGDFSNATVANRVMFQTSSAGSNSVISAIPNGAATQASFVAAGNSDPTNASIIQMLANGTTDTRLISTYFGTGTFLPMTFYTGGSEAMRIDTNRNVQIGTTTADGQVHIKAAAGQGVPLTLTSTDAGLNSQVAFKGSRTYQIGTGNASSGFAGQLFFYDGTAAATRMLIDSSGNVGIGTSSTTRRFEVFGPSGSDCNVEFRTNKANGLAQLLFTNDARTWVTRISSTDTYEIVDSTAAATRMLIDSSGNVGIGLTPTASVGTLQVNGQAFATSTLYVGQSGSTSFSGGIQNLSNTSRSISIDADPTNAGANSLIYFNVDGTTRVSIDASGYTQFSSNNVMPYQGAPTSKAAAATLTGAELVTGILNTTGTTYTITLPTGTNIEGALTWSANNVCLDWWVINTASGTITIGANGNTTLGSLTIATGTSAHFRIRRTAANTFTVYRL